MASFLKDKRVRDTGFQVAFVSSIIALAVAFVVVGKTNLDAQGMTSGFGFLERTTGWRISFSLIEYSTSSPYWKAILVGILNSLFLGALALPIATVIGIAVGVMRTSGNGMAELVGTCFVEVFRNVPLILQLLFWYTVLLGLPAPRDVEPLLGVFAFTGRGIYLPGLNVTGGSVVLAFCALAAAFGAALWLRNGRWSQATVAQARKERLVLWGLAGLAAVLCMWLGRIPDTPLVNIPEQRGLNYKEGIRVSPELMACVTAIAIYGAAYIAEIVRAGFNAVPRGQTEAGHALGLTSWQIFSRIRMPLALRIVMPTLINQYVWLFKATTIGIAISFTDFFMVISTAINQSGQTLELIAILMGGFLTINYTISFVLNRVNDAIKLKGTQLRI
ncbi:amino acid ABC transporter permease [Mameliella alba]|uniref:Polar amino acid ABC transporter inner membrane subunit n=1 Tax=Mameliella alba TaxID=561184 RepID=A0A0B3SMA1_9RHOB|nr:ABC transporter permease subunit [Mameliella alba]KHQ51654.1 Polar amino acid ABC transporter inner membrane subunit [Mameliella alba]